MIWRWLCWRCHNIQTQYSHTFSNVFDGDDIDGGTVQTCLPNDVATSLVWCSGICFAGSWTSKATSCQSFAIFFRFNWTISFLAYGLKNNIFSSEVHMRLDFKAVIMKTWVFKHIRQIYQMLALMMKTCIWVFKYIRQEQSSSVNDNGQYYDEAKVQLRRLYDKPSCLPGTAILVQIHKYKYTNIQIY